jgi:Avidin family
MDVSGLWYNELNSTMELKVAGKSITGSYISAVGDAAGPYDLIGFLDDSDETPTIGWVVVWMNKKKMAHAVTSWCGQAHDGDGDPLIETMWLLSSSTTEGSEWESTMIGHDTFRRVEASKGAVRKARLARGIKDVG